MRARPSRLHALMVVIGLLSALPSFADDQPAVPKPAEATPKLPPLPKAEVTPAPGPIAPATSIEVNREKNATDARIKEKETLASKPLADLLAARRKLLDEWDKVHLEREAAEKPKQTPESEAAEINAELEKTRALLDQASKSPDALLPEVFRAPEKDKAADPKRSDARLGEMKDAIETARNEFKDLSKQMEALRVEGSRTLAAEINTLRADRDKVFQGLAGLSAQRGERQAGLNAMASGEGRDLARERLTNLEWQGRVEVERLARLEALIGLDNRRMKLDSLQIQAKAARVELTKRLAERMESRYAAIADRQRVDLKQAVAREEKRAADSNDPLDRRRAQRTAQLLELESQVVAYEKTFATSSGVSIQEQTALSDKAVTDFEELKKLLDDGTVSPLDALRLKNDFRRIGPERAQIVRTDLAASQAELTTYENALTDAEIDLVNDSRDDRFDRESLLQQLPTERRGEADAMLDELETRHKALLNRRRNVLRNLARRAEETNNCVLGRIKTLDLQYAFIRTHIFWIRDAEPIGATTLAHARDDSVRAAKAVVLLAMEAGDRNLWTRPSPTFLAVVVALLIMPLPLVLGQRALDRLRLADCSPAAPIEVVPEGIDG